MLLTSKSWRLLCGPALSLGLSFGLAADGSAQGAVKPYAVIGDAIPASLTGKPGDPAKGRAIVANRTIGLCMLCHSASVIPEEKFQGNLAPDIAGAGNRWNIGELRLRIVDASRLNAATIMPAYYKTSGLTRVSSNFANKTILSAEQIEDVVTYLATLK